MPDDENSLHNITLPNTLLSVLPVHAFICIIEYDHLQTKDDKVINKYINAQVNLGQLQINHSGQHNIVCMAAMWTGVCIG
jgi:hypothetical protein